MNHGDGMQLPLIRQWLKIRKERNSADLEERTFKTLQRMSTLLFGYKGYRWILPQNSQHHFLCVT